MDQEMKIMIVDDEMIVRESLLHWFEKNGMLDGAVDHALAANDFERAADLIEDVVKTTSQRQRLGSTELHWLQALPGETRRSRPRLLFLLIPKLF